MFFLGSGEGGCQRGEGGGAWPIRVSSENFDLHGSGGASPMEGVSEGRFMTLCILCLLNLKPFSYKIWRNNTYSHGQPTTIFQNQL